MWEMEIESVLEKIWDLHDKLSDAIHSISRSHFLSSINSLRKISNKPPSFNNKHQRGSATDEANNKTHQSGFVFVKDFRSDDEENDFLAVQEAKSLNAIRTALESLEDQLEFFHTVQVQQRAERDAAVARLEQSRIVLAMRLAEHQGKKYRVIEEAVAFVGDVRDACHFVSPENLYASAPYPPNENFKPPAGKRSSNLFKFFVTSFNFAKNSLRMDHMGGVLSNAALVAISMLAFVQLHQASCNNKYFLDLPQKKEEAFNNRKSDSSSGGQLTHLDVMLARG